MNQAVKSHWFPLAKRSCLLTTTSACWESGVVELDTMEVWRDEREEQVPEPLLGLEMLVRVSGVCTV